MENRSETQYSIGKLKLLSIVIRSLFIQASFTLTEKLGVGFAVSLIPGIKCLSQDAETVHTIVKRHSGYFNTHPYLAPFVLGSVLRCEELELRNSECDTKNIENFKDRFAGALGSLGDRLFWKYLKPFASTIALVMLFLNRDHFPGNIFISVLGFLIIFNIFHFFYRWHGIKEGYSLGLSVIRSKSILRIEKINAILAGLTLLFLGVLIPLESRITFQQGYTGFYVFGASAVVAFLFNFRKLSPAFGIIAGLGVSIIIFALAH